ncbi:MAG: N-acetylmuramoyl-L-alanine amidase CwlD [Clostridiaceae bacterium]|nr:N-acetylmuramoyl-L-alanine amidase CwlD [Clostridiaceae bacterium]
MNLWGNLKTKKSLLAVAGVLGLCLLGLCGGVKNVVDTTGKETAATIVIDPGHGGVDPGKVGINGAYEKEINLGISIFLKEALEKKGCQVIMTREEDAGLYQEGDSNKKIADLQKRIEIMDQEEADLVVSIHQNSFSGENTKGAQVFYHTGSVEGEKLAKILQTQLANSLDPDNHRQAKANSEYYILKNTKKTAVIVECGFLSNSEEAEKLCDQSYQKEVAWAIAQGVCDYLENGGSDDNDSTENKSGEVS